jgi:voltage-gated potassium channel
LLFSLLYVGLAQANPASFTKPLDRVSALYFTDTVLSTVVFGDIAAETDLARLVVTIQMLLDLTLLAVVVRVFFSAAKSSANRA